MTEYVVAYNPIWPLWFQQQAEAITGQFDQDVSVYHIGSTAIKGLMAKNCIDMLGVFTFAQQEQAIIESLVPLGFEYRGENGIKGRYYFTKTQPYKVHLHVFVNGHSAIAKHLHYVDVMAGNSRLIDEFNSIKQHLQTLYPHQKQLYQHHKGSFYDKVAALK